MAAIEAAVGDTPGATVMLVGSAAGGVAAAEIASAAASASFTVDQVVTAGAPSAQVPVLPEGTRMLSLEDRADPVALLGSLISAGSTNRLVVVFDGGRLAGRPGRLCPRRPGCRPGRQPRPARRDQPHPGTRLPRRLKSTMTSPACRLAAGSSRGRLGADGRHGLRQLRRDDALGDLALAVRPVRLHPAVLRGRRGDGELRRTARRRARAAETWPFGWGRLDRFGAPSTGGRS